MGKPRRKRRQRQGVGTRLHCGIGAVGCARAGDDGKARIIRLRNEAQIADGLIELGTAPRFQAGHQERAAEREAYIASMPLGRIREPLECVSETAPERQPDPEETALAIEVMEADPLTPPR